MIIELEQDRPRHGSYLTASFILTACALGGVSGYASGGALRVQTPLVQATRAIANPIESELLIHERDRRIASCDIASPDFVDRAEYCLGVGPWPGALPACTAGPSNNRTAVKGGSRL